MRHISRQELERQARTYAEQMVAFLEEQNATSASRRRPLIEPRDRRAAFEQLYCRFVSHWAVVTI
jgi:hypothetical protein